ncbi:MAG: hypothetical protein JXJ04_14800 [Spirochaetales bacterium]|nr:hypothetical protein [Spirochaetales bacterium]
MTKKFLFSLLMISIISCFILTFCSGGSKYGEVKKLLNEYITASNKLNKTFDSAKDGKTVAKGLTEYIKVMKDLSPRIEALPEKYPELEDEPPEELKELVLEFETSMKTLFTIIQKAMEFADDPDVMKALGEFENIQ